MIRVSRTVACLLAGWMMVSSIGCTTLNLSKIDLRSRKATVRHPAIHIVCIWEPAEGRDPKGIPCQGFAGQILFLNSSQLPVSVEGEVKVYEFDNHGTADEQAKPLHVFNFDSQSWNRHYVYGTLGPSYNVFVPYMRRGIGDATCALRVSLAPDKGPAIFSDMTSIELLGYGNNKPVNSTVPALDPRVEETTPEDMTAADKRRKTTTIQLNPKRSLSGEGVQLANGPEAETAIDSESTSSAAVLQAGYEVPGEPKPLSSDDVRIAELERMVKELQAMRSSKLAPSPGPAAPPRRLTEAEIQGARIRVRGAASSAPAESEPVQTLESDSHTSFESTATPTRTKPASRRHPLDEEGAAMVTRAPRVNRHPLADGDAATVPMQATPVRERLQASRHPLADMESDEFASQERPVAPRRTAIIQKAQFAPTDARDPFDPIEVEQIEE